MKKWIRIAIAAALIASTRCTARQTYQDRQKASLKNAIEHRKQEEQRKAREMIEHAKRKTAHRRSKREHKAQDAATQQATLDEQTAYHDQLHRFAQLTQELASPIYSERPILDVIHEAEFTLQKIAAHNPKVVPNFQLQLERALKNGKHLMTADGKKLYPNAEIMARQSIASLIDYTHNAQQLIEQTVCHAQEVANAMTQTMCEHEQKLAASQQRIQQFDTQLAQLNDALRKGELDASQKETQAVNLAQCIDTFNTVSSKFNQDRIEQTEELIRTLEQKAHTAEKETTLLMLRLQHAQKAVHAVECAVRK